MSEFEPMWSESLNRISAQDIVEDEMAPFWDVAEAEAFIEWSKYWSSMKPYLKHIGEW